MRIKFFLLIIFFCSQSIPINIDDKIKSFFNDLIAGTADLSEYLLKSELEKSKRLGIEYEKVKNKFIISFDIDGQIKKEISEKKIQYELKQEKLNDGFSKVVLRSILFNHRNGR